MYIFAIGGKKVEKNGKVIDSGFQNASKDTRESGNVSHTTEKERKYLWF